MWCCLTIFEVLLHLSSFKDKSRGTKTSSLHNCTTQLSHAHTQTHTVIQCITIRCIDLMHCMIDQSSVVSQLDQSRDWQQHWIALRSDWLFFYLLNASRSTKSRQGNQIFLSQIVCLVYLCRHISTVVQMLSYRFKNTEFWPLQESECALGHASIPFTSSLFVHLMHLYIKLLSSLCSHLTPACSFVLCYDTQTVHYDTQLGNTEEIRLSTTRFPPFRSYVKWLVRGCCEYWLETQSSTQHDS